ncbi:MarR family transcriptional regulator [bacterium]|nr:MAG: MarR family transcriptional regulator [bacterium]
MIVNQEPSVRSYVRLVRSAEALHNEISRGLLVEGLTASQFSTMKVLRIHGALAQRDIAKHILKSGGNITIVVDNLERQGLVVRERDTQDRRIVYVKLTPAGEAMFDEVYPGHLDRIREAMSPLTEDECGELMRLLEKLSPNQVESACVSAS